MKFMMDSATDGGSRRIFSAEMISTSGIARSGTCRSSNKDVWNSVTSVTSILSERKDLITVVFDSRHCPPGPLPPRHVSVRHGSRLALNSLLLPLLRSLLNLVQLSLLRAPWALSSVACPSRASAFLSCFLRSSRASASLTCHSRSSGALASLACLSRSS